MKVISRLNLDLDILLSEEEIKAIRMKKDIIPHKKGFGFRIKYTYPVLESDISSEEGEVCGRMRLQEASLNHTIQEHEKEFFRERYKDGVFFLETDKDWHILILEQKAYNELLEQQSLTRRIPLIESQLWIYNPFRK